MTPERKGQLMAMALSHFSVREALDEIDRLKQELAQLNKQQDEMFAHGTMWENKIIGLEVENVRLREVLKLLDFADKYSTAENWEYVWKAFDELLPGFRVGITSSS